MTPQRKLQHKLQDYENYAKIKYTPEIDNTEMDLLQYSKTDLQCNNFGTFKGRFFIISWATKIKEN